MFSLDMTIHDFNQLSDEVQLAYVYNQGTYIARRWDDVHQAVMLYQVAPGFFVEVNYDVDQNEVTFLFPFEARGEDDRLPDYAVATEKAFRIAREAFLHFRGAGNCCRQASARHWASWKWG